MALPFALVYNGKIIDLEEDSYLTVDWFSTLFNESEIFRGSYSYAVKIKLSEKNKALFKMPHLIENRTSRIKYEVSIILFGQTWKNAILEIELVQDYLSGNLLIDNSIIADVLQKTSIPDLFSSIGTDGKKVYEKIDIGETNLEKLQYLNDSVQGSYPMVFPPFRNFGWDGNFGYGSDRTVNNFYVPIGHYLLFSNSDAFSPMFFLKWLIITVCDKIGFKAIGSFFENDEISKWIIFNNSYYTGNEILKSGFKIVISRHLPNLTIGNFFKVLRNDLKVPIYFDSLRRTVTIDLPNLYLENDDFVDLGDGTILNSPKIKGGELKKYTIQRSKTESDGVQQFFDSIDSLSLGNSQTDNKIELTISSPKMGEYYSDRNNVRTFRMPIADHLANIYDEVYLESSAFNKEGEFNKNDFGFMLLSFRGLQQCLPGDPEKMIPFATSDNYDALKTEHVDWIAVNPLETNGWIRKICQPFYQMLSLTEDVEFDTLLPIQKFFSINPLSKIRYKTKNGSISTLVLDKITFEPSNRNSLILSKVKAFSINRSQLLFGVDLQFKIETKTDVPDSIYVFARFYHLRTEQSNPNGEDYIGYMILEFYNDKYKVSPKAVSNLEIKLEIKRNIRTTQSEGILIFEKTYTTGENVYDYQPDEEFVYKSTNGGGAFNSEIILLDPEDKSYIPGN